MEEKKIEKRKICFISSKANLSRGSYRIHVHDLNNYFNKIDVTSAINPRNTRDYDIVIYDKGVELKLNTGQLKGAVTPDRANIPFLKACDFIIVGSVEEKKAF